MAVPKDPPAYGERNVGIVKGEPDEGEPHVRFDEGEQGRPSGPLWHGGIRALSERARNQLAVAWGGWEATKPVPYSAQAADGGLGVHRDGRGWRAE